MHARSAFLPLALLVVALPFCADLFRTDAKQPASKNTAAARPAANSPAANSPAAVSPTPEPTPDLPHSTDPLVIRVGVVNYNGSESTHYTYMRRLDEMARQYQQSLKGKKSAVAPNGISFRLVDGSYDDVLEWYKSGLLNVAILSPGVVADLLNSDDWRGELPGLFVASESQAGAGPQNEFATAGRRVQKAHIAYNSVCLVRRDSKVRTPEQIKELAGEDKVDFLFVHSLSVSGRILPEYVLQHDYQIDMASRRVEWTYDHTESLRQLNEPTPEPTPPKEAGESEGEAGEDRAGVVHVAFVKDDTSDVLFREARARGEKRGTGDDANCIGAICKIPFPQLETDAGRIPQDVVLVDRNFKDYKDTLLVPLFCNYREPRAEVGGQGVQVYYNNVDWMGQYDDVRKWLGALKLAPEQAAQQYYTLEEILGKIRSSKRNRPGETRLALVLSGGGAKCAYQIGAIRAVEEALNRYRRGGRRELDIDLVVGTSGGAINALCVALGVTSIPAGREKLAETWEEFSQKVFFKPWEPFGVTVGLFIGLLQAIVVILAIRLFDPEKINWHRYTGKIAVIAFVTAAGLWLYPPTRAFAVVPLIVLSIVVGARLFGNPSPGWWKQAGWTMIAVALLELPAALDLWTPWRYMGDYVLVALLCLQFVALVLVFRILRAEGRRWWLHALVALVGLFAVEAAYEAHLVKTRGAGYWDSFQAMSHNHIFHHLWLVLTLGAIWTAVALAAVGASLLAVGYLKYRGFRPVDYHLVPSWEELGSFRRTLLMRLAVALAAIVALQMSLSLFRNDSLSNSSGLDAEIARQFPELIKVKHPEFQPRAVCDEKFLQDPDCSPAFREMSQQIIDNGWLTRDLVITSVRLPEDAATPPRASPGTTAGDCELPARAPDANDPQNDLYFYYNHLDEQERKVREGTASDAATKAAAAISSSGPVNKDPRYRPLCNPLYKDKLMDVVIGSTTIFPVFRPRALRADGTPGGSAATLAQLIDGGFAHNSPIEAAVLWGATHIILIEASPEEGPRQRSDYLLANSVAAFNYLFNQAQLVDAQSRGKVEIFSLRPQGAHPAGLAAGADGLAAENPCAAETLGGVGGEPVGANMCTFDFVREFVSSAIDQGHIDANSTCFRRERAHPTF